MWYPNLPWEDSFIMCKKTEDFDRPPHLGKPRVPIETAKTRNLANPEFQSKRNATGDGYTTYLLKMIFLDQLHAQNMFLWPSTSEASEHQSVA